MWINSSLEREYNGEPCVGSLEMHQIVTTTVVTQSTTTRSTQQTIGTSAGIGSSMKQGLMAPLVLKPITSVDHIVVFKKYGDHSFNVSVGDRVFVSIEKSAGGFQAPDPSGSTRCTGSNGLMDIEDVMNNGETIENSDNSESKQEVSFTMATQLDVDAETEDGTGSCTGLGGSSIGGLSANLPSSLRPVPPGCLDQLTNICSGVITKIYQPTHRATSSTAGVRSPYTLVHVHIKKGFDILNTMAILNNDSAFNYATCRAKLRPVVNCLSEEAATATNEVKTEAGALKSTVTTTSVTRTLAPVSRNNSSRGVAKGGGLSLFRLDKDNTLTTTSTLRYVVLFYFDILFFS